MFPSREPGRPRGAWLEAARRRLISSVRADCRMQGVDQYSVFLQIDRSQPARRYCCFDASQIGWSRFPDCWILALSPLGLACPDDSAGERGPLNDARLNDALLDTAGQQLQEFVVQGGGAEAGWESQVGYRNVSVGAIGGLSAWLAFRSWVLIPRVVAVGNLGLGSVSSLVDSLAADAG